MALSYVEAARQINRLSGLHFFSTIKPEGISELIAAMQEVFADDPVRAREFVSDWLRTNSEPPTPAQIYACKSRVESNESGTNPFGVWKPDWLKGPRAC